MTYLIVFQKQLLLKIIYKFMSTHKYVYVYNVKNINMNMNMKNKMLLLCIIVRRCQIYIPR